jgi:hypothetical protein
MAPPLRLKPKNETAWLFLSLPRQVTTVEALAGNDDRAQPPRIGRHEASIATRPARPIAPSGCGRRSRLPHRTRGKGAAIGRRPQDLDHAAQNGVDNEVAAADLAQAIRNVAAQRDRAANCDVTSTMSIGRRRALNSPWRSPVPQLTLAPAS